MPYWGFNAHVPFSTVDKFMAEKKNKGGRPTKYKPEYCDAIIEFFDRERERRRELNGKEEVVGAHLPQFADFAHSIGVDYDTLLNWRDKYPDFFGAYKKAKKLQESVLVQNTLQGHYNPAFAIFWSKNCMGWSDKREHEFKEPLKVVIESDDADL